LLSAAGLTGAHVTPRDSDFRAILTRSARINRQPTDRTQGRQRLAAKPETVDVQQIRSINF
jgi:hypothetical protein